MQLSTTCLWMLHQKQPRPPPPRLASVSDGAQHSVLVLASGQPLCSTWPGGSVETYDAPWSDKCTCLLWWGRHPVKTTRQATGCCIHKSQHQGTRAAGKHMSRYTYCTQVFLGHIVCIRCEQKFSSRKKLREHLLTTKHRKRAHSVPADLWKLQMGRLFLILPG